MGGGKVTGADPTGNRSIPKTVDDQILDTLNNGRMSENEKFTQLKKTFDNLPEADKKALYDRLKTRNSNDPVNRAFHYRLSHHGDKAGQLSTVDKLLNTLKATDGKAAPASKDVQTPTTPPKGSAPTPIDQKTADAVPVHSRG